MPVTFRYMCNNCNNTFIYTHLPNIEEDKGPFACPRCGFSTKDIADYERQMPTPHIAKKEHSSADMVYRQMENASIARAQEAADLAGCNVSEIEGVKITDLKDNLREGDMCINRPVAPPDFSPPPIAKGVVTSQGSLMQASQMQQYSQSMRNKPYGDRGIKCFDDVNALFKQDSANMARRGQMNKG